MRASPANNEERLRRPEPNKQEITTTMSLSKTAQMEVDYRRVTKTRPWLIPVSWAAPRSPEDYNETVAKAHNRRLRRAYQQRRRRARSRAVQVAAQRHGTSSEYGVPAKGWRSRELKGNRKAVSSSETLRRRSMNRAHLIADPRWEREYDPVYGWGYVKHG
jgi:hypothetical protein